MTPVPGPSVLPVARVCLVVLDGWGLAEAGPGNAVSLADTPVFDGLWQGYPHTQLRAWGPFVGLPDGQMGNSEVGHLNLGTGAAVKQDLTRIDEAVSDGELDANPVLREALKGAQRVHLIGLVSDGGVHSSFEHLHALIKLAAALDVPDLVLHCFTDGRDTAPHAGADYLATVAQWCEQAGVGRVASVIGRYFAMDRDKRWERTQKAYNLLVAGESEHRADSAERAVRDAYERGETDEFITPTAVGEEGTIRAGDSVLCFNFRPDRMRQLTRALAEGGFGEDGEEDLTDWRGRDGRPPVKSYACLTEYEQEWPYPVAFPPHRPDITLGSVLADAGLRQLHVAETEKYPHVTYFFNGGEETPYEGERRELVPSPRDVPTYDCKPEMSAAAAAEAFVRAWTEDDPSFAIINFANADMVGHTGVIEAAVSAVEAVDRSLARVVEAVHEAGGACVVTADHGNADHMLENDGSPNTAHSLNPVPLIVTVADLSLRPQGVLADVAPTVLALLGIDVPAVMTGKTLVVS